MARNIAAGGLQDRAQSPNRIKRVTNNNLYAILFKQEFYFAKWFVLEKIVRIDSRL